MVLLAICPSWATPFVGAIPLECCCGSVRPAKPVVTRTPCAEKGDDYPNRIGVTQSHAFVVCVCLCDLVDGIDLLDGSVCAAAAAGVVPRARGAVRFLRAELARQESPRQLGLLRQRRCHRTQARLDNRTGKRNRTTHAHAAHSTRSAHRGHSANHSSSTLRSNSIAFAFALTLAFASTQRQRARNSHKTSLRLPPRTPVAHCKATVSRSVRMRRPHSIATTLTIVNLEN